MFPGFGCEGLPFFPKRQDSLSWRPMHECGIAAGDRKASVQKGCEKDNISFILIYRYIHSSHMSCSFDRKE